MRIVRNHTARLAALALATTLVPAAAGLTLLPASAGDNAADGQQLLRPAAADAPTRGLPDGANATRTRLAELDLSAIADLASGDRIDLALFDDVAVTAIVTHTDRQDAFETWTGVIEGGGFFNLVRADGVHRLVIGADGKTYEVAQGAGQVARVTEVAPEPEAKIPDHVDPPASATHGRKAQKAIKAHDPAGVIDLLVAYTPQAAADVGGDAQMQALIAQNISLTNQTYANSGVNLQANLAGAVRTAQDEVVAGGDVQLDYITDTDGVYDDVLEHRNALKADQVTLMVSGQGDVCGIGWLRGGVDLAFTVVEHGCTSNLTFSHELGHNMGAEHDRWPGVPNSGAIPYGAGFVSPQGQWRSVMAYANQCVEQGFQCPRIPHFSNPGLAYGGLATGDASTNNAQVINDYGNTLGNYRLRTIYPGNIRISGKARPGKRLTARPVNWGLPAGSQFSYQWLVDGSPASATSRTFKMRQRHMGKAISVTITAAAPYYDAVAKTSGSLQVRGRKIRFVRARLRGVPKVGRRLTVKVRHARIGKAKVRVKWYRNGKRIKGAKGRSYKVKRKDRGKRIWARVTVKKRGYESKSKRTKKVKIRKR